MAEAPSAVVTGQPTEVKTTSPQAERVRRVAHATVAAKYQEKLVGTDGQEKAPTTPAERVLQDFHELRNLKKQDFQNGEPNIHGNSDIMMGDLNGKDKYKVPYDHKNAKVKSVDGITDDGELILTFTNDQGEVFKDSKGDPIQIPIATSVVLDKLMLTNEDAFKELVEGDELKVVTAHLDAQKTGSEPSAITLPPEDTLKNLEEMYSVTKVDEELQDMVAEKTPTQRTDELIDQQVQELTKKLTETDPKKQLTETEKERAQKLLGNLVLAQEAKGESGLAFRVDALRELKKAGVDVTELLKEVEEGPELASAEDRFTGVMNKVIEGAKKKISQEQQDEWSKIAAEPGGLLKLLKDKDFQKLMNQDTAKLISQEIFGRELNTNELKDMIKKANVPPELQKELDEAMKNGDSLSLWKILLLIAGGLYAAPFAAAIATAAVAPSITGAGAAMARN